MTRSYREERVEKRRKRGQKNVKEPNIIYNGNTLRNLRRWRSHRDLKHKDSYLMLNNLSIS